MLFAICWIMTVTINLKNSSSLQFSHLNYGADHLMIDFTMAIRFIDNRSQIEWITVIQFSKSPVLGSVNHQK